MADNNHDNDKATLPEENLGLAGRMARAFIHSPLSPLLFFAMLAMGVLGLIFTPRQEDPQISVPMVDIFVKYEGASSEQVASLAIDPLQRIMSEIPGVKHVYSSSRHGQGMVTVEFDVGEQLGPSIVKVHDKLQSNMDKVPPGVSMPLVKPKGIDDVPVVTLTLWSESVDDGTLRTLALDLLQSLKQIPNTGQGFVVGGRAEQVRVEVLPERLSGYNISLDQVANTIRTANSEEQAGSLESSNTHFSVYTGSFLHSAEDISRLVISIHNGVPVYVRDVANVFQGPEEPNQLVNYYTGPSYAGEERANGTPAVTVAISKKEGANGVTVANAIIEKAENLKGSLIPDNVNVSITRNYGETANDKVNELIFKLFIATAAVAVLVWWFLGLRPAVVVLFVIPVVILITVFSAWILGYTIDRVSLFALIFSIGILVDDAIVVVENMYRRWLEEGKLSTATAVDAVREVGNPTILATFTVIAALLPMGFVSGMMGPYMEPIPALGSVAMIFSLIAAFVFTPWLAMRIRPSIQMLREAEKREARQSERLEAFFRRILLPIINDRRRGMMVLGGIIAVFFLCCLMFYTTAVTVKMLPYDNKPEFSVVVDMPEGTALPLTANLTNKLAQKVRDIPEVVALQSYVGTAQPFDFNGMVRHYYLRNEPWQAELHVQLLDKGDRERSSHEIAVAAREMLTETARKEGARLTIVEMPPGPPVLQSIVAEIYGPTAASRREVAQKMTGWFEEAEGIADVDNYMQESYEVWRFEVDTEKAVRRGISVDAINRNLAMAMGGYKLGDVKQGTVLDPTHIVIQVPMATRAQVTRLGDLPIPTNDGSTVPLTELGRFVKTSQDPVVWHKDLRPVEFVVGDAVGRLAAPIYGMGEVKELMGDYTTPDGVKLAERDFWIGPPPDDGKSGFEWTGEWTVTYETFRDMGAAFAVALILIYILVVWEFGNFVVPLVIMAPIPLTLIGIIPGHWLLGAEFTATSMIGFIALAGIIVRNSILLVDFSIHQVSKGADVRDAVILSCKTRTRPIVITALALVAGSSVILFDPIFQGMAISLLFGVLVSTLLTLIVIPLGCISARKVFCPVNDSEGNSVCATVEDVPHVPSGRSGLAEKAQAAAANTPVVGKAVARDLWLDIKAYGVLLLKGAYWVFSRILLAILALVERWQAHKAAKEEMRALYAREQAQRQAATGAAAEAQPGGKDEGIREDSEPAEQTELTKEERQEGATAEQGSVVETKDDTAVAESAENRQGGSSAASGDDKSQQEESAADASATDSAATDSIDRQSETTVRGEVEEDNTEKAPAKRAKAEPKSKSAPSVKKQAATKKKSVKKAAKKAAPKKATTAKKKSAPATKKKVVKKAVKKKGARRGIRLNPGIAPDEDNNE